MIPEDTRIACARCKRGALPGLKFCIKHNGKKLVWIGDDALRDALRSYGC